jgi:pyruvate/2-oxoglutarate dehydrogenase complex dihydrolipoamide acyltransferase (E2) component
MDAQENQRLNEAAQHFADALVQSYKVVSELGVTTQERNAQLTEEFFNKVVSNLRTQVAANLQLSDQVVNKVLSNLRTRADANLHLSDQIADQQRRQVDAARTLTLETVDAYMDFANSMFGFWHRTRGGAEVEATEAAERKAEELEVEEAAWRPDATEAAQRVAEGLGIDLATVEGTGSNGRITAWDIQRELQKNRARKPTKGHPRAPESTIKAGEDRGRSPALSGAGNGKRTTRDE